MSYELRLGEDGLVHTNPGECLVLPVPPSKGYTLRLVLSATSPVAHGGTLHCNYPPRGTKFERSKFYEHKLDGSHLDRNCYVDLDIFQSGAFTVYSTYTAVNGAYGAESESPQRTPEWHFVVACAVDDELSPDALCVQTVLPKSMNGPAKEWGPKLGEIASKGYNMIHFVPLQVRGASNSPFSIADQLVWDPEVFPGGEADVDALVKEMREKHGLLALSDVVLNHTSYDSPWLEDHPEAGYSVDTAPHLEAALALDDGLLKLSGILASEGFKIVNEGDLEVVIGRIRDYIASTIKLWQFYVVDTSNTSPFGCGNTDTKKLQEVASVLAPARTFSSRFGRKVEYSKLQEAVEKSGFSEKQVLDAVNVPLYAEYDNDLEVILGNIRDRQRYLRFELKTGEVVDEKTNPLIESYFTRLKGGKSLVNNGWVWAGNPLVDNAGPQSKAYLLRQVIVWGDCVKLRYGNGPEDNPYLWDRMARYAESLAKHFSGLRIDNAHSTPLHVGEYILDAARRIKPELYVVAELFSGSQDMDKLYIERLGITSLLREALQAHSVQELSAVVQVNSGLPIGSFRRTEQITGIPTHAWLMEVTHDNEMPAQKRTVEDTLATAGLVAMCKVSSGTTMGADECYPTALNVVSESRPYVFGGGIGPAKAILNKFHTKMAREGMNESYTDLQGSYVTVHRKSPATGHGVFLVARAKWDGGEGSLNAVFLEKTQADFVDGWYLEVLGSPEEKPGQITPIPTKLHHIEKPSVDFDGTNTTLKVALPPGGVALFTTTQTFDTSGVERIVDAVPDLEQLGLLELNELLYRAEGEERAAIDQGVYIVPGSGALVYAGLQGFESVLRGVALAQDLGHPLCQNLRDNPWAFEYVAGRLEKSGSEVLRGVAKWLTDVTKAVGEAPSSLRPRYFAATILNLYDKAVAHALDKLGASQDANTFYRRLVLTSVQMMADLPNVSLFPDVDRHTPTMAAGLPHFSEGIMRTWGRDVFLSLGGLLLVPGRLEEAKQHILGFGATLRNGLIPNLLDSGRNPRFNARDAAWFFVQSIQDYCKKTGNLDLLHEKTRRRFPDDGTWPDGQSSDRWTSVGELVYEILAEHAHSITFREHNAGPQIDSHMRDNGFNQHIFVDWATGLVFGGNADNCGTWQDKMGESPLAGSEGVPGTPRDGAAVEIIGLLKSCLRWVNEVRGAGSYNFPETVVTQDGTKMKLTEWENLLQQSFERCFYIPLTEGDGDHDVDWGIVNRRGIYKDLYRSSKPYEDYQLRSNWCIAYVAAPELFDAEHAAHALKVTDEVLRGPLGMATLDPSDWNYRPYYVNSIESTDFATSRGRNYHQGPEWTWLEGMFLQAVAVHDRRQGREKVQTRATVRNRIVSHIKWIEESAWAGLPELTQKSGEFCPDSSPTQAWSTARLIEALDELK